MADLTPYRVILRSRIRAQMQYRTSFVTDILGTVGVGLTELAEVWVIFHNVDLLGGLDFTAALLVFALSNICFSLADVFVGHLDLLPTYIRAGTIDAFYVRPLPLLAQFMSSEISLRRVGRLAVAVVVLAVALSRADIAWDVATVALLLLSIVSGTRHLLGALHGCGRAAVLRRRRGGVHQRLHLWRFLRRPATAARLPRSAADLLDLRRPDRLRRLPAGRRNPRPTR